MRVEVFRYSRKFQEKGRSLMFKIMAKVMVAITIASLCAAVYLTRADGTASSSANTFTSVFPDETSFTNNGTNPFWVLTPGFHAVLEGQKSGVPSKVDITVTNNTHPISGGPLVRVVEEKDYVNGQLIEIAEDYLAISTRTNSVYYFGELDTQYQNGQPVGTAGSWEAGVDGAQFGMLMPGAVLLGARFQQELAPGIALDKSQVINMGVTITVPAGTFQNCVQLQDTSGLTPTGHAETKVFCPGVGEVQDEQVFLTCTGMGPDCPPSP